MAKTKEKISKLEKEISKIKKRNKRVEADKSWELSWTRRAVVMLLTYIAIVIYFKVAGLPRPFLNSVVPAVAFVFSTFSVPYFKKYWKKYIYKLEKSSRTYTKK